MALLKPPNKKVAAKINKTLKRLLSASPLGLILFALSPQVSAEPSPLPPAVIQSRDLLGNTASAIGIGLDSLFSSPDKDQPNQSTMIIRSGIFWDDTSDASMVNSISFRADLPSTAEKMQLYIRAQREDNIGENEETSTNNSINDDLTERTIKSGDAGLFFRMIRQIPNTPWQNTFDAGFTTKGVDLEFISYLRVSRLYQLNQWQIQPEPNVFWSPSNGMAAGFSLHSRTRLNPETTLQNSTNIHHYFDSRTNYFSHGWQLAKQLSPDIRTTYNVRFYANSESDETVETFEISASLRRRIHDNWLYFNVIPADRHTASNNYERDLSITFQFEAKFGSKY